MTDKELALLYDKNLPTTSTPDQVKQPLHEAEQNIKSAKNSICTSCHDLLIKSNEEFPIFDFYVNLAILVDSSMTCPCCLMLLQSFPTEDYKAGLQRTFAENQRRVVTAVDKVVISEYRSLTLKFGAYTQDGENGGHVFGREVNFCTSEASCSRQPIWSSTTGTLSLSARMSIVLDWVNNCNTTHSACKREVPPLPTRVIDIGRPGFDGPSQLITTHGIKASYTALSHCWGSLQPLTTTLSTLHEREQGFVVQSLPKTFRDAIQVTKRLGLQYIWIDSLCIVQDDAAEWQAESAQMATVYQNAYLTLSATAASDGSGGLNWPFEPSSHFKCDGEKRAYFRTETNEGNSLTNSPLRERAWVLQETLLSRRLIHFAEDQLYWQCATIQDSEDGLVAAGHKILGSSSYEEPIKIFAHSIPQQLKTTKEEAHKIWENVICEYNQLKLTKQSDKIAAFAGIATFMQTLLGDTPFLGLWKSNLPHDLLWTLRPHRGTEAIQVPVDLNIPSWSWLSLPASGDIKLLKNHTSHEEDKLANVLEVIYASITWSGQPHTSNIISAGLVVNSRLINVEVYKNYSNNVNQLNLTRFVHESGGVTHPWDFFFQQAKAFAFSDRIEGVNEGSEVWCLEVKRWITFSTESRIVPLELKEGENDIGIVKYLVLILTPLGDGVWKRIGAGYIDFDPGFKLTRDPFEGAEKVTVSLK